MLLATKSGKVYVYNNKKEREILEENISENYKIFTDNDKEKALNYANTKKITGFMTKEMNTFDILCELKTSGINIATFNRNISSADIILNDIYILNTQKRLILDKKTKLWKTGTYKGDMDDAIKDFYNQIKYFSEETKLSMSKSVSEYLEAFKSIFRFCPWTKIEKSRFVGYSDYITLDNIYKEIRISKDYEIKMLDNFKLQDCKQEKIYDIREKEISLEIKNVLFLNEIKNIENGR